MTTIGLIGAGNIGRNLGAAVIRAGYDVILSNAQGPASLTDLVAELGPHARAGTPDEAAAQCDVAVVAIPLPATDDVPVAPLAGKVVIDTCNYFPDRFGPVAAIDDGSLTVPGLLAAHLPTSRVVRAFSHLDAGDIATGGSPAGTRGRRALAVAGDDLDAKAVVARLYDELGFDVVDLGGLAESWRVDPGQPAFITRQDAAQLRANAARATPPPRPDGRRR